jgi:Ca2+-binding RTX toxin-like protein
MRKLILILGSATVLALGLALAGPAIAATLTGTAHNDTLIGTPSADTIRGLAGNDSVWGRRGADLLKGGTGDDRLSGMRGRDHILGGPGSDREFGQRGRDVIDDARGPGTDLLSGGLRADRIFGNGSDTVQAGRGDDRIDFAYPTTGHISCGAGDDTLVFNQEPPDTTVVYDDCEHVSVVSAG